MNTTIDSQRIVTLLSDPSSAQHPRRFPQDSEAVSYSGLYSWWADATAIDLFAQEVGRVSTERCIYVGQTGATKWPSGTRSHSTLRDRILTNHIRGNLSSSTFRYTISAVLFAPLGLRLVKPMQFIQEDNKRVSGWIKDHLRVVVVPYVDRDSLGSVEEIVLDELDPPFNLRGRPTNDLRMRLKDLRKALKLLDGHRHGVRM